MRPDAGLNSRVSHASSLPFVGVGRRGGYVVSHWPAFLALCVVWGHAGVQTNTRHFAATLDFPCLISARQGQEHTRQRAAARRCDAPYLSSEAWCGRRTMRTLGHRRPSGACVPTLAPTCAGVPGRWRIALRMLGARPARLRPHSLNLLSSLARHIGGHAARQRMGVSSQAGRCSRGLLYARPPPCGGGGPRLRERVPYARGRLLSSFRSASPSCSVWPQQPQHHLDICGSSPILSFSPTLSLSSLLRVFCLGVGLVGA